MNIKIPKFTIIVDTREQRPLTFEYAPGKTLESEPGTLYTGDYSIKGLEKHVCIERKSIQDLMGCIGRDRDRFERELDRMRGYEVKCLVVEGSWDDIEQQNYRSKIHPNAAIGTLMGWIALGIPIVMAGNHEKAGRFVARMLIITAKRRLKELASLA